MPEPQDDLIAEVIKRLDAMEQRLRIGFDTGVQQLRNEFGSRHDAVAERLGDVEQQLAHISRLSVEIKRGTTLTHLVTSTAIAEISGDPASEVIPLPGTDRPIALDRACGEPGEKGRAALPEYGKLVVYPRAGAGAETVWGEVTSEVQRVAGAARGGRGGLRATRRTDKR